MDPDKCKSDLPILRVVFLVFVVLGCLLTVGVDTRFNFIGVSLALGSCLCFAIRSVKVKTFQKNEELPMEIIFTAISVAGTLLCVPILFISKLIPSYYVAGFVELENDETMWQEIQSGI